MAKILVVDDQKNMRITLSIMLRAGAHEVDEAADADAAAAAQRQSGYDLVLTDLKLGAQDGIEVLRRTK
jgi:two-component system response regulator HydG